MKVRIGEGEVKLGKLQSRKKRKEKIRQSFQRLNNTQKDRNRDSSSMNDTKGTGDHALHHVLTFSNICLVTTQVTDGQIVSRFGMTTVC